jgi:hypothetical protein
MVAFYLQNSKKSLVSWLLLLTLSFFSCCSLFESLNYAHEKVDNLKDLSRNLDLQVKFPSDTVRLGETIRIDVLYKNITDSTFYFFPIAPLSFFKHRGVGGPIFPLNSSYDVTKCVELKPMSLYSYSLNVVIDESFFGPGMNTFVILYTFNKKKEDNMLYNVLYGHLESKKIELIVKP